MIEIDRIMIEEYDIPVELMMEHAGLNLARLSIIKSNENISRYIIIAGSGNNGGGGMVAGRKLNSWDKSVEIYLPFGEKGLRETPRRQMIRAKNAKIPIFNGLPSNTSNEDDLILDSFIGYGYKDRKDPITEIVFSFFQRCANIISLDVPSGLNTSTGSYSGKFEPLATLTLAFVKSGLFNLSKKNIGELWITDIGVPIGLFLNRIEINWSDSYNSKDLFFLYREFQRNSLFQVSIQRNAEKDEFTWGFPSYI
jgi:NAD(P)H-hydrate epimerase